MRDQFSESLLSFSKNKDFIFLTGDLGFNALETLAESMGRRFINAGVSEQNMISVAAALAKQDFECWAYSIAPFSYARPFEQIRNDVCFHNLPVRIVGNGGGYGYGVMGPTHHAIEDYGSLSCLPNIKSYVPAFNEDIIGIVNELREYRGPAYLRLGVDNSPKEWTPPKYSPWRNVLKGDGPPLVVSGAIASSYIDLMSKIEEADRPQMWVVSEFPINSNEIPQELINKINDFKDIIIIEEHVQNGGLGHQLIFNLLEKYNISLNQVTHLYAKEHVYKTYGSQNFLRQLSNLDPKSLLNVINKFNNA